MAALAGQEKQHNPRPWRAHPDWLRAVVAVVAVEGEDIPPTMAVVAAAAAMVVLSSSLSCQH